MFGGIPSEYIDALNKVGNDLKYKLDCLNFIKDSVENEISFEKIQRHGLKGLYIFLWSLLKETNNKLILIILQTIDQLLQSLNKKYYYKVNFSLLLPHLINKLNDCCQYLILLKLERLKDTTNIILVTFTLNTKWTWVIWSFSNKKLTVFTCLRFYEKCE